MDFLNHRFIANKENIVFLGSSGVGNYVKLEIM